MEQNKSYLINAIEENSKVSLIKYFSIEIWNRLGFIYKHNKYLNKKAKYNEVTITQSIIYEIFKVNFDHEKTLLKIEESLDESSNGADILIVREFSKGYLSFPFQAKLLTTHKRGNNGTYKHFVHSNNGGQNQQIDLLISSAKTNFKSHLAFYLFYNYLEKYTTTDTKNSYYGLSFCSANFIKDNLSIKNFRFSELHPTNAKPFFKFFIDSNDDDNGIDNSLDPEGPIDNKSSYSDVINFFESFGETINEDDIINNLHFQSAEELNKNDNWNVMGSNLSEFSERKKIYSDEDYFKPKFRIIISPKSDVGTNYESLSDTIKDGGGTSKELPSVENLKGLEEILKEENELVY